MSFSVTSFFFIFFLFLFLFLKKYYYFFFKWLLCLAERRSESGVHSEGKNPCVTASSVKTEEKRGVAGPMERR